MLRGNSEKVLFRSSKLSENVLASFIQESYGLNKGRMPVCARWLKQMTHNGSKQTGRLDSGQV